MILTFCAKRTVHSAHAWSNSFGTHDCPGVQAVVDTGTIFASVPAPPRIPGTTLPDTPLVREAIMGGNPQLPQTVENLSNELCVGAEPDQPTVTQDELLTALDELLDSALHDDRCYIHENDTECVCVIGKVRAALPPCGTIIYSGAEGSKPYKCHRNAHPASPDRHVF